MPFFYHPLSFVLCLFFSLELTLNYPFVSHGVSAASLVSINKTDSVPGYSTRTNLRRRHSEIGQAISHVRTGIELLPGRRAPGAEFTNFDTGLGACGHVNVASDFIVALNTEQYEGGKHCGAVITITAKGKTAKATIMDECMECGFNNLDLTKGLYKFFDPTMFGTFSGEWEYGAGGEKSSPKAPLSSPKKPAPATTTSKEHHTTFSHVHPTSDKQSTTVTGSLKKVSTVSAPVTTSTVAASPTTAPAASGVPTNTTVNGNIADLLGLWTNMGGLIMSTVPASS